MAWTFGFCDLDGVAIGEAVDAYERRLILPLNGLPTASVRLLLTDPLVDEISSRSHDVLLKVYQGTTLRFIGDLMDSEEVSRAEENKPATVSYNFAGPLWRLQKRLIGTPGGTQSSWTNTAANTIISDLLGFANTNYNTGIQNGSMDTLYITSVGGDSAWAFKPLGETISEMQAAKVPYPIGTPPAADVFASEAFSGTNATLYGTTDDTGAATWTAYGHPTAISEGTPVAGVGSRSANSDTPGASGGHHVVVGPSKASCVVGVDWRSTFPSNNPGDGQQPLSVGVISRFVNSGLFIRGLVSYDTNPAGGFYEVQKITSPGGTPTSTSLGYTTVYPNYFAAGTWFTLRLLIDDLGNWTLWHYNQSTGFATTPVLSGQDDDLATGGSLASGQCGIWDFYSNTGGSIRRDFDNFVAADFTGPQAFDFELEPIEPTGSPLKIANLNVQTQIGTSKPEVIFEYGTGNHAMKSYRRVTDRKGLLNQAYSLPADFPTNIDVRVGDDPTSRAARGLFQEVVPSDVQDSQLRQALVDAHVRIRGVPRQIITFEPFGDTPEFGTDYIVGDFVTGRAVVNGEARFNALFRVYAVEVNIDNEGKETVMPTLVPE